MAGDAFIYLDLQSRAFIEEAVASGRYRSASEVVSVALQLLQDREASVSTLRQKLIDGEGSGASIPFDVSELIARKRAAGLSGDAR